MDFLGVFLGKEFLLYPPLKKNADYKKKTVFLCLYFMLSYYIMCFLGIIVLDAPRGHQRFYPCETVLKIHAFNHVREVVFSVKKTNFGVMRR